MQDVVFYIAYVSPEGSNIYNSRVEKNGIKNDILIHKNLYPDVYIYLADDFNARTKDMLDFFPYDNIYNIFCTEIDYNIDDFEMNRNSKERYNGYSKSLIKLYCTTSLHILNGRLYDDILVIIHGSLIIVVV
jgi:hypothetical protein